MGSSFKSEIELPCICTCSKEMKSACWKFVATLVFAAVTYGGTVKHHLRCT